MTVRTLAPRVARSVGLLILAAAACRTAPTPQEATGVVQPVPESLGKDPLGAEPAYVRAPSWVEQRTLDGPPVSLTASEGSGLVLAAMRTSAVIEGPLAFTEMHLAFDNPENRTREGTFKIVLPQGASLGRFAMKIGDSWQEGEVVAKERARRAYEDALHKKQDPALLERGAGNEFTARVFPIPAQGRKEIIVSYAQELLGGAPYGLPLRGLPELGALDITVTSTADGAAPESLHREHFVPTADFIAEAARPVPAAVRSGELVALRVRPVAEALSDPVEAAVVLVDTSASRALGLAAEVQAVQDLVAGLSERRGAALPITVAAFDQEVVPVYQGDARDFGASGKEQLAARRALGASNLEAALGWARGAAKRTGATRVVLVTDGVPTAGEDDPAKLASVAAEMKQDGVQRLDVVAVGGLRDDALAKKLVTAGLAHDGVVVDGSEGAATLVRRLEAGTRSAVAVAVPGASWSYPTKLDGVQPGDEVLVYAELAAATPVQLAVGGGPTRTLDALPIDRPLLERAWAQAKIASLEAVERDRGKSPDLEREIVDLSVGHRVLSAYTALLVLESDADYARFHIDRNALADILTVADGRLALARQRDKTLGAGPSHAAVETLKPDDRSAALLPPAKAQPDESLGKEKNGFAAADPSFSGTPGGGGSAPAKPASTLEMAPMATDSPPAASAMSTPMAPAATVAAAPAPARAIRRAPSAGEAAQSALSNAMSFGPGEEAVERVDPYTGKFRQVKSLLARRDAAGALTLASSWQDSAPGDVLALVALGEAAEGTGDKTLASRAYGSIIDLFPSRADLRRFAGERLEHVSGDAPLKLAIDTFDKARRDRPDHPASHRLAAYARVRSGDYAAAFDILVAGLAQHYPEGRFLGVDQILREDLGLVAAAWMKADPDARAEILAKLHKAGGTLENGPSLRFVLNWETDANDVDFHIHDNLGGHAYYASKQLPSGGELYADVTTGYGPECFTVRLPRSQRSGPYKLQAHYFSRGPMGYGMGKLEIIEHDGHGGLKFDERPFVIMTDRAFVDLGTAG